MKKILFIPFAITLLCCTSYSQQCNPGTLACTDTLAANVALVSTSGTYDFADTCVWICTGIEVNLVKGAAGHGLNNVYVESGATVNISSNINGVLAKAGSTVNLLSGSSNTQVICETGATVNQSGLPWSGSCNCTEVIFDYTYAPAAQNCLSTGIEHQPAKASLQVFPNPADDRVTIKPDGFSDNAEIVLSNALGIDLAYYILSGEELTIDVSALAPGMYFLTAIKDGSISAVQKLLIPK